MRLKLSINNDPRALPSVQAFVVGTFAELPLATDDASPLSQLVTSAVKHAVESAYPPGEDGDIQVTIHENAGRLEIRVRDFGLPQDVGSLEKRFHEASADSKWFDAGSGVHAVDQVHWLAFGSQGKALQLIKWLHTTSIADLSSIAAIASAAHDVPLAPKQQYAVRCMLPDEAEQVSQLMYRSYGNTYFNEDVYYPPRIAEQNRSGTLISVVAVGEDGNVAGHCALERDFAGPVAEIGQAAVDPAHRGRGLLDQMKAVLEQKATALGLMAWFADAVTVHTFTQQSDARHGGHVCGVDLAVCPKSEAFRNIAGEQPQRVSCVMYTHWLQTPQSRKIFVPSRHHEMIAAIYDNLQCSVEFGEPTAPSQEHGKLAVTFEPRAAHGTVRVTELGRDSVLAIRHAVRQLVERSRAEAINVELPAEDAASAGVCESLEAAGLGFVGIGPHFAANGDVVKLAYLVEPLEREPIKTFEPFADCVVNYALAEQQRVRAGL